MLVCAGGQAQGAGSCCRPAAALKMRRAAACLPAICLCLVPCALCLMPLAASLPSACGG